MEPEAIQVTVENSSTFLTPIAFFVGAILSAVTLFIINNKSNRLQRIHHARNKTYDIFYNSENVHAIRDRFVEAKRQIPDPSSIKSLDQLNADQQQALLDLLFSLEIPAGLLLIGDLDERIMFNARRYYIDSWEFFKPIIKMFRTSQNPRYFFDTEAIATIWSEKEARERELGDAEFGNGNSHWRRYAPKFQEQLKAIHAKPKKPVPTKFHEGEVRK